MWEKSSAKKMKIKNATVLKKNGDNGLNNYQFPMYRRSTVYM